MANEIGFFTATPPAAAFGVFNGEGYANIAPAGLLYTAGGADTLTRIRLFGRISGGGTADCHLYVVSGGVPTTRVLTTTITMGTSDAWTDSAVLSQALTPGTTYTLAVGGSSGIVSCSSAAQASGMSYSGGGNPANPWVQTATNNNNIYLSGDITAGASGSGQLVGGCLVNGLLLGSLA